ncbi:hypothetical protein EV122DRAFT_277007 [Schizophyllum commune]
MYRRPNPMSYANRQSTALRASVYDAFAELGGLDSNSKVAQWMFSNPGEAVAEEDEESESNANGTLRRRHNQHPSRVVSFPDGVANGNGSSSRPATAPEPSSSSSGAASPTSRGLRSFLSIRFLTRRKTRKQPGLARSRSAAAPRSRDDHDLPNGTPRRAAMGERSKSAVDVRAASPSAVSSRGPSTDDERVPRLVQDKSRESSEDSILATPMSPPRHVRNDTLASWDAVNRYSVTLEDMQKRNPFLHGSRELLEMVAMLHRGYRPRLTVAFIYN